MTSLTDLEGRLSPALPPADIKTANANDVRRFVYTWFTLFEHRAQADQLTAYLTTNEPLSLAVGGAETMRDVQQFADWYEQLLANTLWNFHELSHLTVDLADEGHYDVAIDIDWQGAVTDESEWPTNLPERMFRFEVRQVWRLAIEPGNALDNPFSIVSIDTTFR
ncbi:hypothetical protein AB0L70_12385 [Kribbella sp. NPDC051952]|uniref:hypothetical protein n=1 Tax=Kribbella sp. NPDC051952 TaxID=3154851 RepID=UPI00341EAC7E